MALADVSTSAAVRSTCWTFFCNIQMSRFQRPELFEAVWPGMVVEENTLQAHVSALRKVLGSSIIVTVHGRGYKYAGPQPIAVEEAVPQRASTPMAVTADGKPVIAVLPFANLSGDPGQQFFSDGVTENIIDRLSKYRILSVIGYHSSFALRGSEEKYHDLRDKLAADYVLTGSPQVGRPHPHRRAPFRCKD